MVRQYITWFPAFVADGIEVLSTLTIVPGVTVLHFLIAVAILCIVIGGILIR